MKVTQRITTVREKGVQYTHAKNGSTLVHNSCGKGY